MHPTPLRVEQDRPNFESWIWLDGIPDLLSGAGDAQGVSRASTLTQLEPCYFRKRIDASPSTTYTHTSPSRLEEHHGRPTSTYNHQSKYCLWQADHPWLALLCRMAP